MVGSDFIEIFNKFKVTTYVGLEDFADRLNFLFTCSFLMLCFTVISVKTYFMSPLSCYIATPVSGTGNMDYVNAWCWAEGTYALDVADLDVLHTSTLHLIRDKKIHYYQWVPFVLGLQCVLFYVPRVIWQFFSHNCSGTDLEYLITVANDAVHSDPEKRKKLLDHINRSLVNVLYQHREYRSSSVAVLRRQCHRLCSIFLPSKRLGTKLINFYLIIKILYAANSLGQLWLMHRFLRMRGDYPVFGYELLRNLLNGDDWHNTKLFPRYGGCGMLLKTAAATHWQIAQCALPVNMLNEKIYVFLWFWVFFLCFVNIFSIAAWLVRIILVTRQYRFVKKFLKLNGVYSKDTGDRGGLKKAIRHFCKAFLRQDGVFLLKMIAINTGDVVCSEIVHKLWDTFKKKYAERDFRDDTECDVLRSGAKSPEPEVGHSVMLHNHLDSGGVAFTDESKRPLLPPPVDTMPAKAKPKSPTSAAASPRKGNVYTNGADGLQSTTKM